MIEEQPETSSGTDLISALDMTGVPSTIKGKVQRAIFRLIAGGLGLEYWAQIRDNLDTVDGRSRVNMMLAEHIGKQALSDPEIVERAKARFLGDLNRKQENVEAIARLANETVETSSVDEQEASADAPEPSQDWMNTFIREAENASSNELRQRLANVLAGEATKPGTYSRSTVRFIAEADKDVLEDYQKAIDYRIGDAIIKAPDWNSGEWFSRGMRLEAAGLVSGVTGSTYKQLVLDDKGRQIFMTGKLGLVFAGEPNTTKQLPCWLLTKIGLQVASLLKPNNELTAFEWLADKVDKNGLNRLAIVVLDTGPDGKLGLRPIMVPWDKQAEQAKAD